VVITAIPTIFLISMVVLMAASGGCKAEYKMAFLNNTQHPAIVISRDTYQPVLIPGRNDILFQPKDFSKAFHALFPWDGPRASRLPALRT
jgi:hypothetical protein